MCVLITFYIRLEYYDGMNGNNCVSVNYGVILKLENNTTCSMAFEAELYESALHQVIPNRI